MSEVPGEQAPSLAALKAGDPAAQERFWLLYWERVNVRCARILGYGAEAADISTDVVHDFLYKYVQNITEERAIWSYLKLMATRRSLRRKKRKVSQDELEHETLIDADARPQDAIAHDQLLMPKLADCLSELTPKAQQVLKLRFGQELTTQRIGELVGGSKQYIGRLIRQSTTNLRGCLERTG